MGLSQADLRWAVPKHYTLDSAAEKGLSPPLVEH
jgi:hypothetical protein